MEKTIIKFNYFKHYAVVDLDALDELTAEEYYMMVWFTRKALLNQEIFYSQIAQEIGWGRDRTRKVLQSLQKKGYLNKSQLDRSLTKGKIMYFWDAKWKNINQNAQVQARLDV